jgi:hypothetical protein
MSTTTSDLGEKVMSRLRVIEGFVLILMENDSFKDDSVAGHPPLIDHYGESIVHEALFMLAEQAQDQLLQLMNAAGGAQ